MQVKIKKLDEAAEIPSYATSGSAGFDLVAIDDYRISPKETVLVKTGLSFEIPVGYELQIRPRSGVSLKTKLRVSNSPGTVDSDYRGEVCVIIENTGHDDAWILAGTKIAQAVLCPVIQAEFVESGELSETDRGSGAFGSTGE